MAGLMRCAVTLALAVMLSLPAMAQTALRPEQRNEVELRSATADVAALELQIPDVASGRSARRAMTDLMVRLVAPGDEIGSALALPNDVAVARDQGLMQAQLYIVSQGRLLSPARARCDRWVGDLAVCQLHCDGGAFGLRRSSKGNGLTLILGRLPRGVDDEARAAVRLDACSGDEVAELVLAPSRGRPSVEIGLVRQR